MMTKILPLNGVDVALLETEEIIMKSVSDVLDVLATVGTQYVILHDYNFEPVFFDLSNRKLGEAFQKFANYRVKLAIVGDFQKYPSKILPQFIYESNRQGDFLFIDSVEKALDRWLKV